MNRIINVLKKYTSILYALLILLCSGIFIQGQKSDSHFEISKNLDIYTSIFKELNAYYVDPIEPGKMVKTGIDAMLASLDPYTNYITESDIEEYEFMTTGKYGGIGSNMRKQGEKVIVSEIAENSPAQKAGIHAGDEIISIDNQLLKGKEIDEINLLVKGSQGTQITLKVKDAYSGAESQKIITRGEIEVSSVPYAGLIGKDKKVAFLHLSQFTPACSKIIRNALDSLKKTEPNLNAVVLDLRSNPGGLLNEAVAICNLFIERGQLVVSTKGKIPELSEDFKTQGSPWDLNIPVAILINQSSASASEVVAGTLQDLDRAVVIGERSYGKGLVQITKPVGYNARLKLTTAKYYTPSGRCIQAKDYTHRNEDGSVGHIPDSLKKEYKTRSGRRVLSGGGVDPDIVVKDNDLSRFVIALLVKNLFFDYATQYAKEHPSIPAAGSFALNDNDFQHFSKWLENKDYSYKTETEIALDSFRQIAIREKNFDAVKSDFNALSAKISHDKKQDLQKHKTEVQAILESEIVSRYYYLRGRVENNLRSDRDVKEALDILSQSEKYKALLTAKK